MWKGWIWAAYQWEEELLEELGVKIGYYNPITHTFENCEVSEEALSALQNHWGRFVWRLSPAPDEIKPLTPIL